jgi:formylglycine-generating enzyme required for sulfatase activity
MRALAKRRDARPSGAGLFAEQVLAAVREGLVPQQVSHPVPSQPLAPTQVASAAAGLAPTVAINTPSHLRGHVVGAQSASYDAMPAATKPRSKLLPIIIALALLVVAGSGATFYFLRAGEKADDKSGKEGETAAADKSQGEKTEGETAAGDPSPPTTPPGMVYIPGGEFMMGSTWGELSEQPQYKVSVSPFFIDVHEVTCEQYAAFIRASGHRPPSGWANGAYPLGAARRPVTGVTWDDAMAYAGWAGKRLPTEKEWEYAARGAEGYRYTWGAEWIPGFANADATSIGGMAEVGSYSSGASKFGLFDMLGNAWEWTASDAVAYPGGHLPDRPKNPTSELKIIRGGCYMSTKDQATTTFRVGWPARGYNEYENTGFRCAKDIDTAAKNE